MVDHTKARVCGTVVHNTDLPIIRRSADHSNAICHANGNFSVMVLQVWAITSQLNNISDALIYIFGEKDIRAYLKNKIARNTNVGVSIAVIS